MLIVGGGLIGCAAALYLARSGARVTLIEQGELNSGASGQNAGSLHFQLERRFLEHGRELTTQASHIVALNAVAVQDWKRLEADLGEDLDVAMHGGLMVAETADEVALLEDKSQRERAAGVATELIDGDAARRLCPALAPSILAAVFSRDEGHANPRRVTLAFAQAARVIGAELLTQTRVTALARSGNGFAATLSRQGKTAEERFEKVVIACGAWTTSVAALLNLHLPLFPVALQMSATDRCSPLLRHLVQHVGKRLSMKQTREGHVLIGGGWAARLAESDGRFDLSERPSLQSASLAGNLRAAVSTLPEVARLALLRVWTGVTALSADQLPIVGEIPRMRGCYVAAGGSAFTLGPTFARLLSESIAGRPGDLPALVSPARFDHLNSFMGSG